MNELYHMILKSSTKSLMDWITNSNVPVLRHHKQPRVRMDTIKNI